MLIKEKRNFLLLNGESFLEIKEWHLNENFKATLTTLEEKPFQLPFLIPLYSCET
jgi:hypothetical protein